jgi:hypothetical protein
MQPSVKRAGELAAREDNRSLSSLLETLLIAHLKTKGYLPSAVAQTQVATGAKSLARQKIERGKR